jgi:hypothetical protein
MGWSELHDASLIGESEELQRLLEIGSYDVNEGDEDLEVFEDRERRRERERERERERGVDFLFLPSHLHTLGLR